MYLIPSKPIEGKIIYIAKSFRNKRGSSTTKNVRRLGTLEEIRQREGVSDAWAWAKSQVALENAMDKENRRKVSVDFCPDRVLVMDEQRSFNVGFLFLQKILQNRLFFRKVILVFDIRINIQLRSLQRRRIVGCRLRR